MFLPSRFSLSRHLPIAAAAAALLIANLVPRAVVLAQSSSSSSSSNPEAHTADTASVPRIAQPQTAGAAITLETSEPMFYIAVALNACGYDAGMADSSPVRQRIRDEINQELAASAPARDARDALCTFIREHALNDPGRSLAQYISLALYLTPPPELTISVDETELPPDSTQVVGVLQLVRAFAEAVQLNALWVEHRSDYEGFVDRIHAPLTKMVLDTNIYLHLPVSTYDGRRFLVLLEPMLAPREANARIYGSDFVIVVSPVAQPADSVPMELIRHTYLHYLIEPMIYSRSSAMERLLPLLKPVQQAPLEFLYKSDIAALLTECLIKAVEAQMMDVGFPRPEKPDTFRDRSDQDRYDAEVTAYQRKAELVRRRAVGLDMRQGWVLVEYFYNQLGVLDKAGSSLKDNIGPMVYGMDIEHEQHRDQQIVFLPEGSGGDPAFHEVRRTPRPPTALELGETKLMKGDVDGAGEIAEAALKADPTNPEAHYLLGRVDLMQGDPDEALDQLTQTVKLSHDPRTIAWAHIYLGRMYDVARDPDNPDAIRPQRDKAIAEYRAALANRDSRPDTKAAAEKGIQQPFALPQRAAPSSDPQDDLQGLDPTGKAEKDSYRPTPPK